MRNVCGIPSFLKSPCLESVLEVGFGPLNLARYVAGYMELSWCHRGARVMIGKYVASMLVQRAATPIYMQVAHIMLSYKQRLIVY